MPDPATVQNVTLIKDCLMAVAAIATVGIGVLGLQTWQRQLKGTAQFDAAKAHVAAAIRLRRAIWEARMPLFSAGEFESYPDRRDHEETAQSWAKVYANRMAPVWKAVTELDDSAVLSEAFFGESVRRASDAFRRLSFQLSAAQQADVDDKRSGYTHFRDDREFGIRMRAVISGTPEDENNAFNKELNDHVGKLLEELRPHLTAP